MSFPFYSGKTCKDGGGGSSTIPELYTDPVSPTPQQVWVRATPIVSGGTPIGLLLALTHSDITGYTYELAYRTLEDTTVCVALTSC